MTARRAVTLWVTFTLVHAVLITENLLAPNGPLGDVQVTYPVWWQSALDGQGFPGLTADGVYPFLALGPIGVAAAGVGAWFALVVALDAVALAVLAKRGLLAAYAWLGFQLALGPIALGRVDAITVALAIAAVALLDGAPRVAGILIAVATWVKVWPVALGVAALRAARFRIIAVWSIATAVTIALVGIAVGDRHSVFSFLGQQQGRGIQVESVAATPWLWEAWSGGASRIEFSPSIYTFEIRGIGVDMVAEVLTIAQVLVLLGLAALLVSHRRTVGAVTGASFGYALLVVVSVLVVANKVGSPQFVSWFAVPLVAIVLANGTRATTALLAVTGSIAVLTHVVYPYVYFAFLELRTVPLALLTARNAAELVLLGWSVAALVARLRVEKAAKKFADLGIGDEKGVVPVG
jgi:hypothetical protein